ncbi:hypothetical protein D3C78_1761510 [compost metagenome]
MNVLAGPFVVRTPMIKSNGLLKIKESYSLLSESKLCPAIGVTEVCSKVANNLIVFYF